MSSLHPKVGGGKEEKETKMSIWRPTLPQGVWVKTFLTVWVHKGDGSGWVLHPWICFLPTPLAVAWVFRLTFSPPSSSPSPSSYSPSSHLQLFVSLRYRKHCGSLAVYAILLLLPSPPFIHIFLLSWYVPELVDKKKKHSPLLEEGWGEFQARLDSVLTFLKPSLNIYWGQQSVNAYSI